MAKCRIDLRGSFKRDLRRLGEPLKRRVLERVELLRGDPYLGEPLRGPLKGLRKLVVGKYRVLYCPKPCRVILIKVRHRESVYSR